MSAGAVTGRFYASLAGFTASRGGSFARKRAVWTLRGDRYLRDQGGMRPNALIAVDPKLSMYVLDLINQIAPSLASAYDRHLGPVAEGAFKAWPRRSGLSASLLGLEYTTRRGGAEFLGRVLNRAPYAWFIRWHGGQAHGTVVEQLVFKPGARAANRIAAEAADGLR